MPFDYAKQFDGYAWIDQLVEAIQRNLVAKIGLPEDLVFMSDTTDDIHTDSPPGDRFVTIRPTNFPPYGGTSGGRSMLGVQGMFRIASFTRYEADQEHRASLAISDGQRGNLAAAKKIVDAMHNFIPCPVGSTVALVREPMQYAGLEIIPARRETPWKIVPTLWTAIFNITLTP